MRVAIYAYRFHFPDECLRNVQRCHRMYGECRNVCPSILDRASFKLENKNGGAGREPTCARSNT